jgi:cephalosporin hydroxylase
MNNKLPVPAAITNFELQTVSTQIDLLNNKKIYVEIGSKFGGSLLYFIMEMLIILGFVSFATLAVFSLIDILRQINRIEDEEN